MIKYLFLLACISSLADMITTYYGFLTRGPMYELNPYVRNLSAQFGTITPFVWLPVEFAACASSAVGIYFLAKWLKPPAIVANSMPLALAVWPWIGAISNLVFFVKI